jgi:hypothetical protein
LTKISGYTVNTIVEAEGIAVTPPGTATAALSVTEVSPAAADGKSPILNGYRAESSARVRCVTRRPRCSSGGTPWSQSHNEALTTVP